MSEAVSTSEINVQVDLAAIRKKFETYQAAREAERSAHPTRLYPFEGEGEKVKRVLLNAVDVTCAAAWCDPAKNEAGIYKHSIRNGATFLHDSARVSRRSGTVEVTFEEGK